MAGLPSKPRRQLHARVRRLAAELRDAFPSTKNRRQRSQGFVYCLRIRKHIHEVRIKHDGIGPFAIARGRDPPNALREVIFGAHRVLISLSYLWLTFGLLHSLGSDDSGSWRPLHKGHNQEATAR